MRVKLVPRNHRVDSPTPDRASGEASTGDPNERARGAGPRVFAVLALALVGARIAAVPITLSQDETYGAHAPLSGDVRRFHSITSSHRGTPYRDFPVEYPPVMLGAIEVLDSSTTHTATVATMWSQLAFDLIVVALMWWGWGRRAAFAYLVIGFPLVCYPFLYLRLDLLSVALAVAALALVRRRQPELGGVALAVAVFAKVWPALLVPGLIARRSWRALVSFAVLAGTGLVAWVAWVGTDGPLQVVSMRNATGWEIESTVGSIIRVTTNDIVHYNEGAFRVAHVREWAIVLSAVVLGTAVIAAWLLAARAADRSVLLDGTAALAAVGAFLVCTPLLSPQFAIWLVPFAAIAVAHGDRLIGRLTLLVVALSVVDFTLVDRYANTNAVAPQVVVLARNAALIALTAVCFARLAHRSRPRASNASARSASVTT
jgi:glycosyl transferase family 87